MAETENSSSSASSSEFRRDAECLCGSIRKAFEQAANAFLPPEQARQHFRQARVEMLKGFREVIDQKISNINREQSKGTRVVVE